MYEIPCGMSTSGVSMYRLSCCGVWPAGVVTKTVLAYNETDAIKWFHNWLLAEFPIGAKKFGVADLYCHKEPIIFVGNPGVITCDTIGITMEVSI